MRVALGCLSLGYQVALGWLASAFSILHSPFCLRPGVALGGFASPFCTLHYAFRLSDVTERRPPIRRGPIRYDTPGQRPEFG
jgi:hypothetical protein